MTDTEYDASPKKRRMSHIRTLIARFETAAVDRAFIGAMHPDDHAAIDDAYERARTNLHRAIEQLTEPTP